MEIRPKNIIGTKFEPRFLLHFCFAKCTIDVPKFLKMFTPNSHNLHTLQDVMRYTVNEEQELYADYGMKDFEAASQALSEDEKEPEKYKKSLDRRYRIGKQLPELLEREQCDLLVAPSWTETTANVAGSPQISVPIGRYPSDFKPKLNTDGRLIEGPGIP